MVQGAFGDLRLACRQLLKSRAFTITAVLTLALGIGANTAIFTLIHAVMLKSLPVADPQKLYRLGEGDNCCNIGGYQGPQFSIFSYPLYLYLRDHTPEFEQLAAFQAGFGQVGVYRAGEDAESFCAQFVSGNYFSMFGLHPFAGRLISSPDDAAGAPPVAVMSYRLWQQRYDRDPSVVGSTFTIDGAPFTVAGIAPPGFFGDTIRPDPPDFWMPLATEPGVHGKSSVLNIRGDHWLYIIGRLKSSASIAGVEARVNVELRQWLTANDPPFNEHDRRVLAQQHVAVVAAGGGVATMKADYGSDLRLLMMITGMVLLIACANLANLQLARSASGAAQMSIRTALGAARARLVRQILIESALLAVVGGAAGLLVASELTRFLVTLAFHNAYYVPIDASPSLPVLGFAFGLSLITGVIFGIAPAWLGTRADPADALRAAGRSTGGRETIPQKSLVVLQAALSLTLLSAAGLMIQTMRNLTEQQFGFNLENRIALRVSAALGGYSPEAIAATYRNIEHRIREVPGVGNVSFALYGPMEGNNWQSGIHTEERPAQLYSPSWDRVSAGFFDVIGAHIIRGRGFDERDTPGSTHVAIVNETFAVKVFPGEDPIGKRFGLGAVSQRGDYQIVGVVNDIRFRNPRLAAAPPMFFLPLLQLSKGEWSDSGMARSNLIGSIQLRLTGKPAELAGKVRRAVTGADPHVTVWRMETMREELGDLVGHERMIAQLAQMFGMLALVLAAVGLYGVTSYSVARRVNEIGIRGALGARRADIIRMILRSALAQIALGLAIGLPAAMGVGRLLRSQLFGVRASDPWVLAGAALTLVISACAAGFLPALRASGIDPVRALRME